MAGDWIKMRGNLWDDPRVARLVDMTDSSEAAVVGGLYWLWATADQHTQDGLMPGLSLRQIDRKTGIQGLGKALCDIGWLSETEAGVRLENFEEHNGQSAKRRCVDAQRKATVRTVSASDADKSQTSAGQETPNLGAREEKRREEKKEEKEDTAPRKRVTPPKPDDIDQQVWDDWLSLRKAKRAPVSLTVLEDARRESSKAGMSLENFLRIWCRRGSQGLEAAWLKPDERSTGETAYQRSMRERVEEMSPLVARKAPGMAFDRATQILDCVIVEAEPLAIGGAHG
ncbi:hypothetical protein [Acidovorax sp. Root70]|uniref:hypothetical protein n=1 Tax=Acidovorax sp. Root70 TaxID=1736590 RepID=UPI0006F550B4|nr:hypothetical protein [Acidovorax sp. Root70]KRB33370.1 hypothetical protein ASD94_21955 [Acidovorax sp. Root70]